MLDARTLLGTDVGRVTRADLARLSELHALLFALDDPAAAATELGRLCAELPPLEARLVELAKRRTKRVPRDVHHAISLLGNRAVEKVLLELLEDLTVLKADLEAR